MQDYRDIILAPIVTEKSMKLMDQFNQYTFKVAKTANKVEIAKAVESLFGVKVKRVNTINVKPKKKRVGRFVGTTSAYKKAIVTLAPGEEIKIFGEEE